MNPFSRLSSSEKPLGERVKWWLFGGQDKFGTRLIAGLTLVLTLVMTLGAWYLATTEVSMHTSSYGYLAPFMKIATSVWGYTGITVFALRGWVLYRRQLYARAAAAITGYDLDTVRRLAAEVRAPLHTTRAIITTGDTVDDAYTEIEQAVETEEDSNLVPAANVGETAENESEGESEEPIGRLEELDQQFHDITNEIQTLEEELELGTDDLLNAELSPEKLVSDDLDDTVAPIELLDDEAQQQFNDLETKLDELETLKEQRKQIAEEHDAILNEHQEDSAPDTEKEDKEDSNGSDDRSLYAEWSMWWMDTATTLDASDLIWKVTIPAAVVFLLELLAVQLWVQWYIYPVLASGALLVGILNYARVQRKRRKNIDEMRATPEPARYDSLSVLVKTVETPEITVYVAWLSGKTYTHYDREEFIHGIAERSVEVVNGEPVSPSIMRKYTHQLSEYFPDLPAFEDKERKEIAEELLTQLESAPNGMIPKIALVENTIEHDIEYKYSGLYRVGKGFDPDLVREVYVELVPAAIVEETVEVEKNGEELELTACRIRTEPIPPGYAEEQAQFSSLFANYAGATPLYEMPDVTDDQETPTEIPLPVQQEVEY